MSLTNSQIEAIADGLKSAGFNLPDDFSADELAKLAQVILDALEIEFAN